MKVGSEHTNDFNIFLQNLETLQITRTGTEVRYKAHGGTGQHRFMNKVFGNDNIDIASGKRYQVGGSQIAMADLADGGDYSTSAVTGLLAPKASPTFTGVPAAPTAAASTDTTQIATTAFVQDAIELVVGAAPAALNTLAELGDALGDDADYAATITSALALKAPIASPTFTGTVGGVTKAMVGLGNADNTSDANKPVSTAQQNAIDLKRNISDSYTKTEVNTA